MPQMVGTLPPAQEPQPGSVLVQAFGGHTSGWVLCLGDRAIGAQGTRRHGQYDAYCVEMVV